MVKRMKLWVAGAFLLAVGGTVVASNMGFKLVPDLNQANKVFTLSLPQNNNYTLAHEVFDDINASCPGAAQIVETVTPSVGGKTRQTWNGTGDDFPITGDQGLLITVSPTCTSYVVVGSHNPSHHVIFSSAGLMYLTGIPYHTTATSASELYNTIPNATILERIVPSTGGKTRQTWNGTGDDFPIKIGESYLVVVGASSDWVPSHY